MSLQLNVSATTNLQVPSNGRGAACTLRAGSNAADTTYTGSTVNDANATPWNQTHSGLAVGGIGTAASGDLVVTADGYFGTVLSVASPLVTLRPVPGQESCWRHMSDPKLHGRIPANAGKAAILTPSVMNGVRGPRAAVINLVEVTTDVAAGWTITVTDAFGNTVYVLPSIAASTTPLFAGLEIPLVGPFGIIHSNATPVSLVQFDLIG